MVAGVKLARRRVLPNVRGDLNVRLRHFGLDDFLAKAGHVLLIIVQAAHFVLK